jgi:arylsulfatase A-like enzyme
LTLAEDVTHVPLTISGPGVPDESITDPVSLKDIFGTILSRTGVEPDEADLFDDEAQGVSFAETYPVNPERVDDRYEEARRRFGERKALYTAQGRVERRYDTDQVVGDSSLTSELDAFVDALKPVTSGTAGTADIDRETESRLEDLGYINK